MVLLSNFCLVILQHSITLTVEKQGREGDFTLSMQVSLLSHEQSIKSCTTETKTELESYVKHTSPIV